MLFGLKLPWKTDTAPPVANSPVLCGDMLGKPETLDVLVHGQGRLDPHQPASPQGSVPRIEAREPLDHAVQLLNWLQSSNGKSGTITSKELQAIHIEMCTSLDWEICGWVAVGRELRILLGGKRNQQWRNGLYVTVFKIPPARVSRPTLVAA